MVSSESVLLIVAADRRELAGLAGRLRRAAAAGLDVRWARAGWLGGRAAVLAAHGAGRSNAAQAVERVCAKVRVAAVVSAGMCGALDPALAPGQVVVAGQVLSLEPRAEFAARTPRGTQASGAVLTLDHVVQTVEEKSRLRETSAAAVEMEAAGVAAEAEKRGLPFYCIRVVSDGAGESFALDYNRARRPDGRFSAARIMAQAGLNPSRWREIQGWRRRMRLAAQALAEFFERVEFEG
ncbi:MAG TPA: hypothetical protein VEU62_18390 [Bryobacterales bacterium]|nr:hypothetical protein [Bryobacterales bacterium]